MTLDDLLERRQIPSQRLLDERSVWVGAEDLDVRDLGRRLGEPGALWRVSWRVSQAAASLYDRSGVQLVTNS
jgi:hypothetical protein